MSSSNQLMIQSDVGMTLNALIVLLAIFAPLIFTLVLLISYKIMRRVEDAKNFQEISSESITKVLDDMQNHMELKVYKSGKISNGLIRKAWIKVDRDTNELGTSSLIVGSAMIITVLIMGAKTNFITSANALSINYNTSIISEKSNSVRYSWKTTLPSLSKINFTMSGFKICDLNGKLYDCTYEKINGSTTVNSSSTLIALTDDCTLCRYVRTFRVDFETLELNSTGYSVCYAAFVSCGDSYCSVEINSYRAFDNSTHSIVARATLNSINYWGPTDQICIWWFPECEPLISAGVLKSIGSTIPGLIDNMNLLKSTVVDIATNQNNLTTALYDAISNLNKQIKVSTDSNDNYGKSIASLIRAIRDESIFNDWRAIVRNYDISVINYDYQSEIIRANNANDAFESGKEIYEYISNKTGLKVDDVQKFGRFVNYKINGKEEVSTNWVGPANVKYVDVQISYKPSYIICNSFSCKSQSSSFTITDIESKVIFNALDSNSYDCIMNGKCISNTILTLSNSINKNSLSVSAIIEDSTLESTYVGTTNNFFLIDDQTGKLSLIHTIINLYYKDMNGKNTQINAGSIAMIIKGLNAIDIYSDSAYKNRVATIQSSYDFQNIETINVGVIDKNKAAAYIMTAGNSFLETSQLSILPANSANDIEKLQAAVYGNLESINDTIERNKQIINKLIADYEEVKWNIAVENPDSSLKDTATAGLVIGIFALIFSISIIFVLFIVFYLYKYNHKLFKKLFGEKAGAEAFIIDDGPSREDFIGIEAPLLVIFKDGKSRTFSHYSYYIFYKIINLRCMPKWEAICFIPLEQFLTKMEIENMKLKTSLTEEVFKRSALSQRYKYKEQIRSRNETEEIYFDYGKVTVDMIDTNNLKPPVDEDVGMPINRRH